MTDHKRDHAMSVDEHVKLGEELREIERRLDELDRQMMTNRESVKRLQSSGYTKLAYALRMAKERIQLARVRGGELVNVEYPKVPMEERFKWYAPRNPNA